MPHWVSVMIIVDILNFEFVARISFESISRNANRLPIGLHVNVGRLEYNLLIVTLFRWEIIPL